VTRVRAHGLLSELPGAEATDHICWVYDDDDAFDAAVREFLAGGLARGERLLCVGERVIDSLTGDTAPLEGVEALIAGGRLMTLTLAEAYDATGTFVPERQLAFYDEATRRAISDGYRGLRVVAEVSSLAADPARRSDLIRWEHLADEFVAHGPGFSAMCAYRGDLPREALADVVAVHPLVHAPESVLSFRLFFDDHRIVLAGSVDTFSADRLACVLASSPLDPDAAVLDLSPLEFLDVAGCRALARWARALRARSVPLEVVGASPLVRRMWQLLGLGEFAPVAFAEARG
jgi:anti-anti-sigma factor